MHVSTSAGVADEATEDIWNNIKTGLLKTTEEVCGTTRPHHWRRETWWWNEHVEKAIAAKQTAFKAWKAGKGTRASSDAAKRNARHAVHHARQEADKKVYENIDPMSSEVYHLANQFRRENTDVVGDKPVKNDAGEMSMSEDSKQKAWLEHYQRLLNVEFDWDPDHLSYQPPVEGPQLPPSQADRAGYENPGEDCGLPHQTVGVNRQFPVWLCPRQRHYRCNLCCQTAAREVSSCQ